MFQIYIYISLRLLTPPMETPDPPNDTPETLKQVVLTPHDIPWSLRDIYVSSIIFLIPQSHRTWAHGVKEAPELPSPEASWCRGFKHLLNRYMKDFGCLGPKKKMTKAKSRYRVPSSELKYPIKSHFWVDACPFPKVDCVIVFPGGLHLRVPGAPPPNVLPDPMHQGKVEKRFSRTAMRYFKSWFLLDIVIAPWHCMYFFPPKNGHPKCWLISNGIASKKMPKKWPKKRFRFRNDSNFGHIYGTFQNYGAKLNLAFLPWWMWTPGNYVRHPVFGPQMEGPAIWGARFLQTEFIRSWYSNPLSISHYGSMGLVYLPYMLAIHVSQMMPIVGKYTSPMDPMGFTGCSIGILIIFKMVYPLFIP